MRSPRVLGPVLGRVPIQIPVTEARARSDRGHDALIVLCIGCEIGAQKVCASSQSFCRIERLKAHNAHAVGFRQRRPIRQHAPDIILLRGHHSAEPKIARSGTAVQLVPSDVAFLNAGMTPKASVP